MSTEDSFFNNPTVQSILSRRGQEDRDDTKDFILSLILNGGVSFFQGFNQALPAARAEAIQGVQDNINIGINDNKTEWLDKSAQRKDYQNFIEKGGFKSSGRDYLRNQIELEYGKDVFPLHENADLFSSYNQAKRQDAEFAANVDSFVSERLAEEINKYKGYEQDKFITTSSLAQLNQTTRREMAAELLEARELPTNAYQVIWNKMKDTFGEKEAAVIGAEAALNESAKTIKPKQEALAANVFNPNMDLSAYPLEYKEGAAFRQAQKNLEQKDKFFKNVNAKLTDGKESYRNMEFDIPSTSSVSTENGIVTIAEAPAIAKDDIRFNTKITRNLIVEEYNPKSGEYELTNNNPREEFLGSVTTTMSIYQNAFGQAGLEENPVTLYEDVVQAYADNGNLSYNGKNYVFKKPRRDLSYKALTQDQLATMNTSQLFSYAIGEHNKQENAAALSAGELFNSFKENQVAKLNSIISGKQDVNISFEDLENFIDTKEKFATLSGVENAKAQLEFLFNPPEDYKDSIIKINNGTVKLSNLNQEAAQSLLDNFQESTGESYESLQKLVNGLPTIEQQTAAMTPEIDSEVEGTPSQDLSEDMQNNLTGNALRAQKLRESREVALRTGNVDFDFVAQEEGFRTDMYVPLDNEGNVFASSGPTIGTGVDLGQMNENDLVKTGVSKELIEKLSPYLGLKKDEALKFVKENPLSLSEGETLEISKAVQAIEINKIANTFEEKTGKDFSDLNPRVKTIVVSTGFQYGAKGIPTFMQLAADTIGNETRESFTALQNELLNFADSDKDGITDFLPRRTRESEYLQSLIDNIFVPKTRKQTKDSLLSRQ